MHAIPQQREREKKKHWTKIPILHFFFSKTCFSFVIENDKCIFRKRRMHLFKSILYISTHITISLPTLLSSYVLGNKTLCFLCLTGLLSPVSTSTKTTLCRSTWHSTCSSCFTSACVWVHLTSKSSSCFAVLCF